MSIADKAPPSSAVAAAPVNPAKAFQHRIRKGQKLDEVRQAEEAQAAASASAPSPPSASSSTPNKASSASSSSSSSKSALAAIDSPFQLQEYLALLVRRDPHNVERIVALPPDAELDHPVSGFASPRHKTQSSAFSPADDDAALQPIDPDVWVYEQLRRLVLDLSTPWITALQQECDKHSRPHTCAAMNAGDWMFLCASHGEEKQCCAIDYMTHTLDGATSLLNSARHFPSRTYVPSTSLRHFGAITRRLSRIFVHAWCYHRDTFEACEAETSLYSRFYQLVETYDLSSTETLPPRTAAAGSSRKGASAPRPLDDEAEDDSVVSHRSLPPSPTKLTTANGYGRRSVRSPTVLRKAKSPRSLAHLKALGAVPSTPAPPIISHHDDGNDLGIIHPPAPSPRPTAILQRLERDDDEQQQQHPPPSWSTLADADAGADSDGEGQGREGSADLHRSDSAASTKTAVFVGDAEAAGEEGEVKAAAATDDDAPVAASNERDDKAVLEVADAATTESLAAEMDGDEAAAVTAAPVDAATVQKGSD